MKARKGGNGRQEMSRMSRSQGMPQERCGCRLERQLQNQMDTMKIFTVTMMDSHAKRKRENDDKNEKEG